MFGVSPAFVLSKYGTNFTVDQFCDSLNHINEIGFKGFQPEVFRLEELDNWKNGGAKKVSEHANNLGLVPTQFVGHFLLESFSSPEKLLSDFGFDELNEVIEIVEQFKNCETIVVPIGHFNVGNNELDFIKLKSILTEKLNDFLKIVESSNRKLALEVMPYSIVEGLHGFLNIHNKLCSRNFGISLDTGHAWASRELVSISPLKLKDKIFGLHLCDNDSDTNKSLAPGKGTIDWDIFIRNLISTGYNGSFDIEIICAPDNISEEYTFGKETLKNIIDKYNIE